jgi:hypothetical protein
MKTMSREGRFSRLKLTTSVAALALVGLLPGSVAAASHPITFSVKVGEKCVSGTASDGALVHFVWNDADGTRKARTDLVASSSGDWTFCSTKGWVLTEIGDRMTARDGTSTHEFVVPELTLYQNRVKDLFKGTGPAGHYIRLICGLSDGFESCQEVWQVKVNSEGKWSLKPGWDVPGGGTMFVTWKDDDGDRTWVANVGPYVALTIGQAGIEGSARVGSPATVVLKDGNTLDVRGTAHATGGVYQGLFSSRFRNDAGKKVKVHVGDRVTSDVAADLDWIVTDIEAHPRVSRQHVTGQCGGDSGLFRVVNYRGGVAVGYDYSWTDEDGSFDMKWHDDAFQSGDSMLVWCPVGTGDWIRKWFDVA